MSDKYIAQYQVTDANNQVISSSQIEVTHKDNADVNSPESKEALENQILLSLSVEVTKLEKQ